MRRRDLAAVERTRLCDLLAARGPHAPTAIAGWTTHDLAAHLVVRESSPLTEAVRAVLGVDYATRRATARFRRQPYIELVARIRRGGLLPTRGRLADGLHLLEFVVHGEDVRRVPGTDQEDYAADDDVESAVFGQLRGAAARLGRRIPSGVGLLVTSRRHGSIDIRRGPALLRVSGNPVDLALWLSGRHLASCAMVDEGACPPYVRARVEQSLVVRCAAVSREQCGS